MQRLVAGISMPEIQSFDNLRSDEFKNIIIVLKIIHKFLLTRNDYFVKTLFILINMSFPESFFYDYYLYIAFIY